MSRRATHPRSALRIARFLTVLVAITAVVVGTVAPVTVATASASQSVSANLARTAGDPAQAGITKTSLAGFSAGNIISDAVFTNKSTMTEAQIQNFFNSKVSRCQSGYVCLKDFKISSVNRPADAYCSGYTGAANETAARIIYRVAQSCNINPQVLIVMLQKEQGLITHTWPSPWRYDMALGQGCPDTAPCDPNFVGFFHQIYGAARQMQIYMEGKWFQWYAPGNTWGILYHPNTSCGRGNVYVANKATAALYYYTPYQPNAAALRAGFGEGDGCSSYGNRNFYNYFTDWFGPTQANLRAAISRAWEALGGANGPLGNPTGAEKYVAANGGGYVQEFQRGTIWLRSGAGTAYGMGTGPLRSSYLEAGGPGGSWGWLTSVPRCGMIDGGCLTVFQKGTVGYSAATGSSLIPPTIATEWNRLGAVAMGYPTAAARCGLVDQGCLQSFQRATVGYSPATGAVSMSPAIAAGWNKYGAVALGYPNAPGEAISANGGGEQQQFTRGTLWTSASGAFTMGSGALRNSYLAAGGPSGKWGWPAGAARCGLADGGCLMVFQNGSVGYSPGTGSVLMTPAVAAEWNRLGIAVMGYPTSTVTSGIAQNFTKGAVVSSSSLTIYLPAGEFLNAYVAAGGATTPAGPPVAQLRCGLVDKGCLLASANGTIGFSPGTGLWLIPPSIAAEWNKRGVAVLGYPTEAAKTNGTVTTQKFQKGTVTYDSATKQTTVS
ncbi:LGFP repeat-containing protein [Microbacterium sp.]|uniref:LGFP repeat-containing protein n=1 Tax=Microbacterium sp. TaxID=51671 RepID=UPI0027339FAC|nr:hypothetical protein [Microbacterium sp.]MDP3952528.1 hypothetical protein [Microbacterium sp.]